MKPAFESDTNKFFFICWISDLWKKLMESIRFVFELCHNSSWRAVFSGQMSLVSPEPTASLDCHWLSSCRSHPITSILHSSWHISVEIFALRFVSGVNNNWHSPVYRVLLDRRRLGRWNLSGRHRRLWRLAGLTSGPSVQSNLYQPHQSLG